MVKANYKNRRANSKLMLKENHIKRRNPCLRLKSSDIKVDEVGHSFPYHHLYLSFNVPLFDTETALPHSPPPLPGAFINHVDMAGERGGGLPNVHITT